VALLVPVAFSIGPIWAALRITPAEAISDVSPRKSTSLLERILAKLEGIPRIVMLSFRGMFRNNVRLVVTMLTLIVAGGIFISILNLRAAIPVTLQEARSFGVVSSVKEGQNTWSPAERFTTRSSTVQPDKAMTEDCPLITPPNGMGWAWV
jgi:hypothetical protein